MDCHNRPSHSYELPERAVDNAMYSGSISAALPFARKKSVELLRATYGGRDAAARKIPAEWAKYYQQSYPAAYNEHKAEVESSGRAVLAIYNRNIFPEMKVTWGRYPVNVGHTDFPGCFRCHDDSHAASDGRKITQDCSACHNLLAMEEPSPKILTDLGLAK
jgi:formate-dependent nitrite reductase cytochrome c552 subunit